VGVKGNPVHQGDRVAKRKRAFVGCEDGQLTEGMARFKK